MNTVYSPAPIVYDGNLGPLVFVVVSCELMMRRVDALGALPSLKQSPVFLHMRVQLSCQRERRGKQALLVVSC